MGEKIIVARDLNVISRVYLGGIGGLNYLEEKHTFKALKVGKCVATRHFNVTIKQIKTRIDDSTACLKLQ